MPDFIHLYLFMCRRLNNRPIMVRSSPDYGEDLLAVPIALISRAEYGVGPPTFEPGTSFSGTCLVPKRSCSSQAPGEKAQQARDAAPCRGHSRSHQRSMDLRMSGGWGYIPPKPKPGSLTSHLHHNAARSRQIAGKRYQMKRGPAGIRRPDPYPEYRAYRQPFIIIHPARYAAGPA